MKGGFQNGWAGLRFSDHAPLTLMVGSNGGVCHNGIHHDSRGWMWYCDNNKNFNVYGNLNVSGTINGSGAGISGMNTSQINNNSGYITNNNNAYYSMSANWNGDAGYRFYTGNSGGGYQAAITYEDYGGNTGSGWYFKYQGSNRYQIRFNGAWVGQVSDERLKENIVKIPNVLNKIMNINGVYYNWIDKEFDKGINIGLIAQEVEKQFPEIVDTNNDGYKMVSYTNFVPILVEYLVNPETNPWRLLLYSD